MKVNVPLRRLGGGGPPPLGPKAHWNIKFMFWKSIVKLLGVFAYLSSKKTHGFSSRIINVWMFFLVFEVSLPPQNQWKNHSVFIFAFFKNQWKNHSVFHFCVFHFCVFIAFSFLRFSKTNGKTIAFSFLRFSKTNGKTNGKTIAFFQNLSVSSHTRTH